MHGLFSSLRPSFRFEVTRFLLPGADRVSGKMPLARNNSLIAEQKLTVATHRQDATQARGQALRVANRDSQRTWQLRHARFCNSDTTNRCIHASMRSAHTRAAMRT